jgi:hypothetical protein
MRSLQMNKKFEQLIEYVINDEEDKARALFHDIVVEKSRQIYEEMMDAEEEEIEEAREEDEESVEEAREEEEEENLEEMMGGDSADDLIDDVDVEEEGISMEADDEEGMDDMGGDEAGGDDIEGKLMNIEDKLDELMAEFEALMGDDDMGDDMGGEEELDIDIGGDEDGMDMDGEMDLDMDAGDEEPMPMGEAISLKAAPKPTTSEEGGINKKSIVAANSGARGMEGKPVHTGTSQGGKHDAAGAYSNNVKDLISDVQNTPAKAKVTQKPAPKPHLAQATGVNTKSPL